MLLKMTLLKMTLLKMTLLKCSAQILLFYLVVHY